jgi:hypothetical protein
MGHGTTSTVIKSKRLRWEGYVTRMWERKTAIKKLAEKSKEEDFRCICINVRTILQWILESCGMTVRIGIIWAKIWTSGGL